jgi:hypothetical protein
MGRIGGTRCSGRASFLLNRAAMPSTPAYKTLETWQHAMTLVEECYKKTSNFPRTETYGLTS